MHRSLKKYWFYIVALACGGAFALFSQDYRPSNDHSLSDSLAKKHDTTHFSSTEIGKTKSNLQASALKLQPDNPCNKTCKTIRDQLLSSDSLHDENYETLLAHTQRFTEYLVGNFERQNEFINLAISTSDANKRDLIIEAFKGLPKNQSMGFAFQLLENENWEIRVKSTELLEGNNELSDRDVQSYYDSLSREQNSYVKQRMVQALVYSDNLLENENLVSTLDSMIQHASDASVRSTALRTKVQVSNDTQSLLRDAVYALNSGQQSFQITGLSVYENLLKQAKENEKIKHIINQNGIIKELENVIESARFASDESLSLDLFQEFEYVYERHFSD